MAAELKRHLSVGRLNGLDGERREANLHNGAVQRGPRYLTGGAAQIQRLKKTAELLAAGLPVKTESGGAQGPWDEMIRPRMILRQFKQK